MVLFVSIERTLITAPLRKKIETLLRFATDRFEGHVREIALQLKDINGSHRGGVDKLCTVSATFSNGERLHIKQRSASVLAAVGGAARRLRRSISRRVGRVANKKATELTIRAPEYWIG